MRRLRATKGRFTLVAAVAVTSAVVLASCASPPHSVASSGRTVTFAEQPGSAPNYIFPMLSGAYFDSVNQEQFQYLMYLPLYWFGKGGKPVLNEALSLAKPPVYSDGNTVVSITMKGWKWSNGTTVNARDVMLWMNLLKQEKTKFGPYVPGTFPDNVASYRMTSPMTIQMKLTHAYSANWFTDNELSQVTPLPLAWDRNATASKPGSYDSTPAGAQAVYKFLIAQAAKPTTYATNPLWQIVDGPWHLSQFDSSTGYIAFSPNKHYSGQATGKIQKFVEEPFTSASAEFNAVRSGQVDYGYIPAQDVSQANAIRKLGYNVDPWNVWAFTYVDLDYLNPAAGPIFAQPYVRQAMQSLINQPQIIKTVYSGDATPTNGPVPLSPATNLVSAAERRGVYSFSPSRAVQLLSGHGWAVHPGGVTSCARPGAGAKECGAGIGAGATLTFKFLYVNGTPAVQSEVEELQSEFKSAAGIGLQPSSMPIDTMLPIVTACAGTESISSKCTWQMAYFGAPRFLYEPDYYPTGEDIYATGAADSGDGYSNAGVNKVIATTEAGGAGVAALQAYENLIAELVPTPFLPTPPIQISAIRTSLHGAMPQDSLTNIYPQDWTWG